MSRVCSICGKGSAAGNSRSHALNITKRVFRPNIHKRRDENGETVYVCSKCLKGSKKDK